MKITRELAAKVLTIIDAGLTNGLGRAKPGHMCIEAAVCYALGEPHNDKPSCVSPVVRSLKIRLNDSGCWHSNQSRAQGLRRLGIAQLGTAQFLDDQEFAKRVAKLAIQTCVPAALRAAADLQKKVEHREALRAAALKCEDQGDEQSARQAETAADAAAYAAANAANAAAYAAYAAN